MGEDDEAGPVRERRRRRIRRHRHPIVGAIVLATLLAAAGAAAGGLLLEAPQLLVSCEGTVAQPRVVGADSFVYAGNGSRLGVVPTPRNREPVRLGRMSHWVPAATIAIEDRRFWDHGPLDYEAIARAAIADVGAGRIVQGGSTLTQQLVRARYMPGAAPTVERKVREACLAMQLARRWSKRRILQEYLNSVFYGHRAYGIQAAAYTYFARPASRLRLTQAALLAGLPQAPSVYDPLRDPEAATARRNEVLRALRSTGAINATQLRRALTRPLGLRAGRRYVSIRAQGFFEHVFRKLRHRFGAGRLRSGGLRIHTTFSLRLQKMANAALANWLRLDSDPAGALVALDPRTGAIRAMATRVPNHRRLRFNLATQSRRQAGSAFKVFTLTAAVAAGMPLQSMWNGPPSLTIPNRRCMNGTNRWKVHNFADEAAGRMTLLNAIAHSVNTIFAQVSLRVGLRNIVEVAHRLGIRSPLTPVCSLTLGPEGVSPLEMTTAFATLAADGIRHYPDEVRRVISREGEVLPWRREPAKRVISSRTVETVTYALTGVIKGGTGTAADPGRPAAGKTGTAEKERDAWFCGFVPQLATCVWIGYPKAEIPMKSVAGFSPVVGGSVPARIWHDFMVPALANVPVMRFPTVPANQLRIRR